MTTTTVKPAITATIDEQFEEELFLVGDEFTQEVTATTPYAQILNPVTKKGQTKPYGIAIAEKNAESVRLSPSSSWEFVEYEFKEGAKENFWISKAPRLLVIHTTNIFLKDKETNKIVRQMKFNDGYDKEKMKSFTNAFVFVLKDDNTLAHEILLDENEEEYAIPFKLTLNGVSGIKFNTNFVSCSLTSSKRGDRATTGFVVSLEKAYALRKLMQEGKDLSLINKINTVKEPYFSTLGIYCPKFEIDEVGSGKNTSEIAAVKSYEMPTEKNITKYWFSPVSQIGKIAKKAYDQYKDYQPQIATEESEFAKSGDDGFSGKGEVKLPIDELGGFDDSQPVF